MDAVLGGVQDVLVVEGEVEHARLRLDVAPEEVLAHPRRLGLRFDLIEPRVHVRPMHHRRVQTDDQAARYR